MFLWEIFNFTLFFFFFFFFVLLPRSILKRAKVTSVCNFFCPNFTINDKSEFFFYMVHSSIFDIKRNKFHRFCDEYTRHINAQEVEEHIISLGTINPSSLLFTIEIIYYCYLLLRVRTWKQAAFNNLTFHDKVPFPLKKKQENNYLLKHWPCPPATHDLLKNLGYQNRHSTETIVTEYHIHKSSLSSSFELRRCDITE